MNNLRISLSQIREQYPQIEWQNFADVSFQHVQNDSRCVVPETLFFALSGVKDDGDKYVPDALDKGAIAFITEKEPTQKYSVPYGIVSPEYSRKILGNISHILCSSPTQNMKLFGITGTNGKTTTSFFLHRILCECGYPTGLLGTIGYFYANESYDSTHTTPDSLVLNKHFARMKDKNISHAVMEVSSHSLVLDRVYHLEYSSAIFTNLGHDHLDYHKDMESYREAKALLFSRLSSNATAIFNYDDENSKYIQEICPAKPYWYSIHPLIGEGLGVSDGIPQNIMYACNIRETSQKTEFELATIYGHHPVTIFLPGIYNVYNALSAATCAWSLGIPLHTIALGLERMSHVPGRMQRVPNTLGFEIFIDFAHTQEALEKALCTLHDIKKKRLLVVFGCGGDRDANKRPVMGKIAQTYADYTWITNDNPRTESPMAIAQSIAAGFDTPEKYTICLDRKTAIETAIGAAAEGDILIIAGKGHETTQIVGKQIMPFSDEHVVQECLKTIQDH